MAEDPKLKLLGNKLYLSTYRICLSIFHKSQFKYQSKSIYRNPGATLILKVWALQYPETEDD